jgi:hypothetical protein
VTNDGGSPVAYVSADRVWSGSDDDGGAPVLLRLGPDGIRPVEGTGPVAAHLPGTVFPGFTDHHVHLGLVHPGLADAPALQGHGLAEVHDLGWIPGEMAKWTARSRVPGSGLPEIRFAGAFLTAPGGYPAGRSWAPEGSWREVASASDASRAVAEQWTAGASFIKLVLNSEVGPVPEAQVVRAVVDSAHEAGLPVVAHAQGAGQAQRAFEAGVDRLAHTPWTELLADSLIAAMAGTMTWISTLDIHGWGSPTADWERAVENLRRFVLAGGTVRYGTDLGNGPLPQGLNRRELMALAVAGLGRAQIIGALAPAWSAGYPVRRISWTPEPPPAEARRAPEALADWLLSTRVLAAVDILEEFA